MGMIHGREPYRTVFLSHRGALRTTNVGLRRSLRVQICGYNNQVNGKHEASIRGHAVVRICGNSIVFSIQYSV